MNDVRVSVDEENSLAPIYLSIYNLCVDPSLADEIFSFPN